MSEMFLNDETKSHTYNKFPAVRYVNVDVSYMPVMYQKSIQPIKILHHSSSINEPQRKAEVLKGSPFNFYIHVFKGERVHPERISLVHLDVIIKNDGLIHTLIIFHIHCCLNQADTSSNAQWTTHKLKGRYVRFNSFQTNVIISEVKVERDGAGPSWEGLCFRDTSS